MMSEEIDLASLVQAALDTTSTPRYLDRLSGQILPAAEVAARCGRVVAVQERYVRVPVIPLRVRLDDARDFASTIQDPILHKRMDKILHGPRAPWAFERELARRPAFAEMWYKWEHACATARILGWLGRIDLPFQYPDHE